MKRTLILAAALGTLLGFALPARQAQASVSVGVSIGSGRHGGFSLSFASRPNVVLIPSSRVYYAPDLDEDLYAYDDQWYYCDQGAWFMADSYEGPFAEIAFASVPYEIRNVPVSYRRHWSGDSGYSSYAGYSAPYRSTYRPPVVTAPTHDYRDGNRTWGNQDQGNQTWGGNQNQVTRNRTRYQNQGNRTWGGNQNQGNGTWNDRNDRGQNSDRGRGQGGNQGNGRGRHQGQGQGQGQGRWGR